MRQPNEDAIQVLEDGSTIVKLNPDEAAVVFHDGKFQEICFPKQDEYPEMLALFIMLAGKLSSDREFYARMREECFGD